jgi:hypothetical protein
MKIKDEGRKIWVNILLLRSFLKARRRRRRRRRRGRIRKRRRKGADDV